MCVRGGRGCTHTGYSTNNWQYSSIGKLVHNDARYIAYGLVGHGHGRQRMADEVPSAVQGSISTGREGDVTHIRMKSGAGSMAFMASNVAFKSRSGESQPYCPNGAGRLPVPSDRAPSSYIAGALARQNVVTLAYGRYNGSRWTSDIFTPSL